MTPLERWLAVLRGEKPDRVPMDYWATDEFTARLMAHLGCSSKEEALQKLASISTDGYSPKDFAPQP